MPKRLPRRLLPLCTSVAFVLCVTTARAADQWIEVKSAHFTITSDADQGSTRELAWQLEQIRSAIAALWPWAKVDLNKPLTVMAAKDETAMKALVPQYWEIKNGVRPATVWAGGPDQNFLVIRTDTKVDDKQNLNPYATSYFSYVSLILRQSLDPRLPAWYFRGLAGVLSNTLVRQKLLVGEPVPWYLRQVREGWRIRLASLVTLPYTAPELKNADTLAEFDAESWALVHFLMFADKGAHAQSLDRFQQLVVGGAAPDVAFHEALGAPEALEGPIGVYVNRSIFSFMQFDVDASVRREKFETRPLPPSESASRRALLHVAMNRPAEARAAIAEARKAGPAPDSDAAEGFLLGREGKKDEERAALERAAAAGTTDAYAYYRLATLTWQPNMDTATAARLDELLRKTIALNPRDAFAYAFLGDQRSAGGNPAGLAFVMRAVAMAPAEPYIRLTAGRVLLREKKLDEALQQAQAALTLSDTDSERHEASALVDRITAQRGK